MSSSSAWRAALAASAFVSWLASPRASAHDVPGIPDFSDSFAGFRTVGGTGIPSGNGGLDGRGFPVDPRDLADSSGRARVFHEHFESATGTYDGTVVFCVFNGPPFSGCTPSSRIAPPLPVTYTNASRDYSVTIDFGAVSPARLGPDDAGALSNRDWIFAYAIVNDEGASSAVRGTDPVSAFFLSFSPALRQVASDLPGGAARGLVIGAGGDVEPSPGGPDTTGPDAIQFSTTFGEQVLFVRSGVGDGAIPDVLQRTAPPPGCKAGPDACTSNVIFLASPFGPGVCPLTHLVAGNPVPPVQTAVLGPLTYPGIDVVDVAVDNHTHPGEAVAVGDEVEIDVRVSNPPPSTPPPYLDATLPAGTQRVSATVSIAATGGVLDGLAAPVVTCLELDSRLAVASFVGRYLGPDPVSLVATAVVDAPYASDPFDSDLVDYRGRFPVDRERLAQDPSGDTTASVPTFVAGRKGTVNGAAGAVVDVLFVNDQAGSGDERKVWISEDEPIRLRLAAPPSNPLGPAPFVVWAWAGEPRASTAKSLPLGTGLLCMPMALTPSCSPQPLLVANAIGRTAQLGTTVWPRPVGRGAPTTLASAPTGTGIAGTFFVQGVLLDAAAPNRRAATTNGVVVVVHR
jgi:hypothetical protein